MKGKVMGEVREALLWEKMSVILLEGSKVSTCPSHKGSMKVNTLVRLVSAAGPRSDRGWEPLGYKQRLETGAAEFIYCVFELTWSFHPQYGPGVESASNGNEYQESS
jgi:hypothetical protein